jgi:hypothetical protein
MGWRGVRKGGIGDATLGDASHISSARERRGFLYVRGGYGIAARLCCGKTYRDNAITGRVLRSTAPASPNPVITNIQVAGSGTGLAANAEIVTRSGKKFP